MKTEMRRFADRLRSSELLLPLTCYALLALAQRGIWVLMLPVYIVMLAPNEFGVLVLLTFAASILAIASNLKLDAAMRTFYFDYAADADALRAYLQQVLTASVIFAFLNYVVMLALGPGIFSLLFEHDDVRFFPLGAIAVATACINACLAPYIIYLRNGLLLQQLVWLQLAIITGNLVLQLFFIVVLELGVSGALLGSLVPSAIALGWVIVARRGFSLAGLRRASLAPSLRYSAPLIVFALFYVLESRLDVLVLEHYVDMQVLGAYGMLISILGLLSFALNALDNAIRPYLYPALQRDDETTASEITRFERIYVVTGLSVLSFAVLLGTSLGLLTDDPDYLALRKWLAVGATAFLPEIVTRYHSLFYDFHKRSFEVTYWIIVRTLLMFGLLLLVVPAFGIGGALVAVFVSQLANAVVFSVTARRKFSIRIDYRWTLLLAGMFLAIIWVLYTLIAGDSMALFGGLQFVLSTVLLVLIFRYAAQRSIASDGDTSRASMRQGK